MNLFNIGVDGPVPAGGDPGGRLRRGDVALPAAAAHRRSSSWWRWRSGAHVGRHRRPAQGDPRRQRGHLDDHAELHRHRRSSPTCWRPAAWPSRPQGSNNIATPSRSRRAGGCPGIPLIPGTDASWSTASSSWRPLVGRRLLVHPRPHPLRLRPAGHRACSESAAVASGVNVKKMIIDQRCCSPARSPAWSACRSCSARATTYYARLPGRARLHRHRDRPARPQQPDRHRLRRAAVRLPRPSAQILDLEGVPKEIVADHAGRHRAVASSSPTSWCAATPCARSPATWAASSARPARRHRPGAAARRRSRDGGAGMSIDSEVRGPGPGGPGRAGAAPARGRACC